MSDALSLITSLGREGKSPAQVAQDLYARGVKDARGRTITPAVVEGFLRFAELAPVEKMGNAAWGKSAPVRVSEGDHEDAPALKKKRKNLRQSPKHFSEAQRAEIARLYHVENMKSGDIARKLGLSQTHLNIFLGSLAGLSVPPGEITEYVDDQGRRIVKLPPGYARGAYPQRNVGGY